MVFIFSTINLMKFENNIIKIHLFTKFLLLIFYFVHGHDINVLGLGDTD